MANSVAGTRGLACWLALILLAGCDYDGSDPGKSPQGDDDGNPPTLPQPEPQPEPELPPVEEPPPDEEGALGSATLSWLPPTEFTDGSYLHNLGGYRIHYGTESGDYDSVIEIDNAGITSYVVEGLTSGTYYFSISAVTTSGLESAPSAEASKTI